MSVVTPEKESGVQILARGSTPGGVDTMMIDHLSRLPVTIETRPRIDVHIPFTGEVLGSIPHSTADDVVEAVRRARAAQRSWAARSFDDRAEIFIRFHDAILRRQNEVLDLVQLEAGKTRRNAFEEVLDTAIVSRYYAVHAEKIVKPRRRRGALPGLTRAWEFHLPVGVVGYIVPWNYPLNLAITDAIPALMAGNTAVLRPDPQTSFTALWAVNLLYECGLPPEVFPVVTGPGSELGPPLIQNVDFIMFTGSTATGKIIARQAADRLIGMSLELGGKNPMIVLSDANLDDAVAGAVRGSFVGAGQVCVSIERIFVEQALFDPFVKKFAEATKAMRVGHCLDFSCDMGSLTSERQLRTVTDHVTDAVEKGARVVAGGKARPDLGPYFYEPTILVDVAPGMKAYDNETFGPVVAVYPFTALDEAIERANDTIYGLNASVWSRDSSRAIAVANRIKCGTVNVNEAYVATWGSVDAEIGGMKQSGISRRHGREGILKYTETQTVALQRLMPIGPPPQISEPNYNQLMSRMLKLVRRTPGLR